MMPDEFYRIYKRLGSIKYLILSWFTWLLKIFLLNFLGPMKVGFHTSFGDGTEIPDQYNAHVHDVTWKNIVFNRWKKGDILMIDNFRISHGRQVNTKSNFGEVLTLSTYLFFCSLIQERGKWWFHGLSHISNPVIGTSVTQL